MFLACNGSKFYPKAEPIDVLFVAWTQVGPMNPVLGGGPDPHGKGIFGETYMYMPACKATVYTCRHSINSTLVAMAWL